MTLKLYKIILSSYDANGNDIDIIIKTTSSKDHHTIIETIKNALQSKGLITGGSSTIVDWSDIDLDNLSLLKGDK